MQLHIRIQIHVKDKQLPLVINLHYKQFSKSSFVEDEMDCKNKLETLVKRYGKYALIPMINIGGVFLEQYILIVVPNEL